MNSVFDFVTWDVTLSGEYKPCPEIVSATSLKLDGLKFRDKDDIKQFMFFLNRCTKLEYLHVGGMSVNNEGITVGNPFVYFVEWMKSVLEKMRHLKIAGLTSRHNITVLIRQGIRMLHRSFPNLETLHLDQSAAVIYSDKGNFKPFFSLMDGPWRESLKVFEAHKSHFIYAETLKDAKVKAALLNNKLERVLMYGGVDFSRLHMLSVADRYCYFLAKEWRKTEYLKKVYMQIERPDNLARDLARSGVCPLGFCNYYAHFGLWASVYWAQICLCLIWRWPYKRMDNVRGMPIELVRKLATYLIAPTREARQ